LVKETNKFHLSDFPFNLTYVKLTKQFWSYLLNLFNTHLSISSLSGLVESISNKKTPLFSDNIPFVRLSKLDYLLGLLEKKGVNRPEISEIEKHILAMKGYGVSGILLNPKLPVNEDKYLVRLVVQLIGDGYLPKLKGSSKAPSYSNTEAFLRLQFLQCLNLVFGDVSDCSRHYIGKTKKSRSYVAFSKWIGYVLRFWYPDAKFDHQNGSFPSSFFALSLELKAEMVRALGDDDGHVGAHCVRFTSGGATILAQVRGLIVELMEATLPPDECAELMQSVGAVKACRSWFILDVYRPLFAWYAAHIGFSHPERAARLAFQLECDRVWVERGLDGFDLDFLVLIGLREVGSVGDVARRFTLREDFVFRAVPRLQKLGWLRRVEKRKFTTYYQTTSAGEVFLERVWGRGWSVADRVVMEEGWWRRLRKALLCRLGSAAAVARAAGMPETTTRGYLQGRRQWMEARWVVALANVLGWGAEVVSQGVVVGFGSSLAPRYEQCDFLAKAVEVYQQFSQGVVGFAEWLAHRGRDVGRTEQLLDAEFATKLQSASAIRNRIVELAVAGGGEVSLVELKGDAVVQELVATRYPAYVADRMAKLIQQGVFVRVAKGRYRLVDMKP
jgi:hypothetical protein